MWIVFWTSYSHGLTMQQNKKIDDYEAKTKADRHPWFHLTASPPERGERQLAKDKFRGEVWDPKKSGLPEFWGDMVANLQAQMLEDWINDPEGKSVEVSDPLGTLTITLADQEDDLVYEISIELDSEDTAEELAAGPKDVALEGFSVRHSEIRYRIVTG